MFFNDTKLIFAAALLCMFTVTPVMAEEYIEKFDPFAPRFDTVVSKIEGKWNGTGHYDNESFELKVSPSPFYTEVKVRQVGDKNNTEVPYPTVCKYRQTSSEATISKCKKADLEPNRGYCNMYGIPSDYIFSFDVEKIELIDDLGNDKHCENFIANQREQIAKKRLEYSFPFSLNADGNLIQYGRDLYKKEKPASTGTHYVPVPQSGEAKGSSAR